MGEARGDDCRHSKVLRPTLINIAEVSPHRLVTGEYPMPITWTDRFNAAHEAEEPLDVWHEFRAGNLTCSHRDVLVVVATYHPEPDEPAQPRAAAVAAVAICNVKTVSRALSAGRRLGLVP
jgi:hypothetical protein